MKADQLEKKKQRLEKKEEKVSRKEKKELKESEELLQRLKEAFFKEAQLLADNSLGWLDRCSQCLKVVDAQSSVLRKLRSDAEIILRLAEKSEELFRKDEIDDYILARSKPEHALWAGDAHKMLQAKKLESLIEKLYFLVRYDLEMLLEDQDLRKLVYAHGAETEAEGQEFTKEQYEKLLKDCAYLNEMFRYTLGQERLEKFAIILEFSSSHEEKSTGRN